MKSACNSSCSSSRMADVGRIITDAHLCQAFLVMLTLNRNRKSDINICLFGGVWVCDLCSGKHRLHDVRDPATLLFTLDLHWNSSYLLQHMECVIEKTEDVFWLELIRKGLKFSQKEIESPWGGEEVFAGN